MRLALERIELRVGAETWLDGIDLALEPGRINVLLGPTRAGKTSLMRVMAGLERPNAGRVLEDGRDVTRTPVRERDLAMVYQQFINYPSLSVRENIASPLKLRGETSAAIDARVAEVAAKLRITHLLDRLPSELSGGQQQRTALARALAKGAHLLLLDEPLVNLDYKLREELRSELRALFSSGQTTVVYATTEPMEALLLGGSTAVLDRGRLLQYGDTLEVFHRPASRRVAEIFNDPPMNFSSARIDDDGGRSVAVLANGARLAVPGLEQWIGREVEIGIRPPELRLDSGRPGDLALQAQVALAEISGSETFVHFDPRQLAWVAQLGGVHRFEIGASVDVFVDPCDLFVFGADGRLLSAPLDRSRSEPRMAIGAAG